MRTSIIRIEIDPKASQRAVLAALEALERKVREEWDSFQAAQREAAPEAQERRRRMTGEDDPSA